MSDPHCSENPFALRNPPARNNLIFIEFCISIVYLIDTASTADLLCLFANTQVALAVGSRKDFWERCFVFFRPVLSPNIYQTHTKAPDKSRKVTEDWYDLFDVK